MYLAYALLCADADGGHASGVSGPLSELGGRTAERELIALLRQGDHEAFKKIYRVFHPRLIAIAEGYVHSPAIAEDLSQDTLIVAWDRREQWTDADSLIVYLYATVRNRALKYLRHEGVVGRVAETAVATGDALGNSSPHESIADAVENADLQAAVLREVNRLPDMQRTAFMLRWVHQLEYDEIATIMGIAVTAVRKHVSRARATLMPTVLRLID